MSIISEKNASNILAGSSFLGCGGGGSVSTGRAIIDKTQGKVDLISIEEARNIAGKDGLFVTISPVGSPASTESYCDDDTYSKIISLLRAQQSANPTMPQGDIVGLIPCEIGASSAFGPFMTAAQLGLPVVDASCDGRAHPLGVMGSLGLEKLSVPVIQVGCGGNPDKNKYVEVSVIAAVDGAANIIRNSAANAGGLIEVARNPVDITWLEKNAAIRAYTFAQEIGAAFFDASAGIKGLQRVAEIVKGEIVTKGVVGPITIETKNALDYGHFNITASDGTVYTMTFCNEYMAMDGPSGRKYTFPDFMVTASSIYGLPKSTAELVEGEEVYLLGASRKNMILGSGLRHRAAYERLESALGIKMIEYIQDILTD